jgi:hypothetical protein
MELNRKLTHLLKRRTIQSESGDEGRVAITFDDQSTLKLKVVDQATVCVGAKVEAVHEAGERFQVDLAEDASVQVRLVDPGSSVSDLLISRFPRRSKVSKKRSPSLTR